MLRHSQKMMVRWVALLTGQTGVCEHTCICLYGKHKACNGPAANELRSMIPQMVAHKCRQIPGVLSTNSNMAAWREPACSPEDPAEGCQKQPAHRVLQDVYGFEGCVPWFHPHQGWHHDDRSLGNYIGSYAPLELPHQPHFASQLHLVLNGLVLVSVLICSVSRCN